MTLTPEHAAYLAAHAVDLELAERLGVRSVAKPSELPDEWRAGLGRYLPGLLFPWTSHDGRVSAQLRPDSPRRNADGDLVKYEFQSDATPVLWAVRFSPAATKALLVEGSKQCLVAASYAPEEFNVLGVAGCWGWSHDGVPVGDLAVTEDREVVVIFDADAATNLDVYTAAERLAAALEMAGAIGPKWVRLPAGKTAGLDDVLAAMPAEKRASALQRLIAGADEKIAKTKPKARRGKKIAVSPDRPPVNVDDDPLVVIDSITKHLIAKWDGRELFNHGGILSLLVDGAMHPLDKDSFNDLVVRTITPVVEGRDGGYRYQVPSGFVLGACHVARTSQYTPLDRLTKVPFVRPDGSVCTEPGYDTATQTFLVPSDDLAKVAVPENPTPEDVRAAVALLDEWFCDMPFPDQASKANTYALVLTYFIRGLVPVVPLAVVTGLQMSVGKNLLADCISIVALGRALVPKAFNESDDENRKALLASFKAGEPAVTWDEAHTLHGTNLARAITAETYSDRILGVSTEAQFPNRMVWTALGNQVQVLGDIQRRVYPISLRPTDPDPQDRDESRYRHPLLREWTRDHRAELISACLTLVRSWFVAGRPAVRADFGSFEAWQRIVGGVLAHAGIPGFLENRKEWARDSSYDAQHWSAHTAWLVSTFGEVPFTCRDVKAQAQQNLAEYEAPPGLEDVSSSGYTRALGLAYKKRNEVWCDGWQLVNVGTAHAGANKWQLRPARGDEPGDGGPGGTPEPPEPGDSGVSGDTPPPPETGETPPYTGDAHARVYRDGGKGSVTTDTTPTTEPLVVDLETASATELHSYGAGFVRIAGYAAPGKPATITADIAEVVRVIEWAEVVIGHNLMGFDLIALARYHGLDLQKLVRRDGVFDTLLAARHWDPPMAREKGVDFERRYDLDTLGKKFEVGGKTHDLKALAKKHGGFDQIPLDDKDYREYLAGDLAVNDGVHRKLAELVGDSPYLRREHRVAAIAAQISLNGFRVDTDLLTARLEEGEQRKGAALARLHERYGVPLADEKGKFYAAPLATKAGKAALVAALTERGATGFWTTGKTEDIATSAEAMKHLALQHHHNREVVEICKLVAAVVTTRTVYTTIASCMIEGDRGTRVHPTVTMKQSTGRWSLSKPGLTVMGKRGGRYRERMVFAADPGEVVIAVDLSQVDMRAIAGLSQDQAYIEMLRQEDPHAEIARLLFGDPSLRDTAKPIGHGWNYGRGLRAISDSNEIPPALVRQFDESMRERFPRLVEWREEVRDWAGSGELLDNGFGRRMRPDPSRAHTQGPALMGQGAARDIMMEGLLRLPDEVLPMLRAQVHDEIVLSVPAADAVDIQRAVIDALSFEWRGVPIVADGGPTDRTNWGDVYRKD